MTKFNVGDKVIPISKTVDWNTLNRVTDHLYKSGVWNRASGNEQTFLYVSSIDKFRNLYICSNEQGGDGDYFHESDLIPYKTKPTKNQRITALENEVAELKLIVHELRGKKSIKPSTTGTVEDIIEFEGKQYRKVVRKAKEGDVIVLSKAQAKATTNVTAGKPYKVTLSNTCELQFKHDNNSFYNSFYYVYYAYLGRTPETVDVYELIKSKPLTPNQQRAAIIEKAKQFVENIVGEYDSFYTTIGKHKNQSVTPIFHVNEKKRAVTVLIYGAFSKRLIFKGIAKCNPSDVYNEHVGKAIALGRALGLDVSEFEQVVQPTEFVTGQIITYTSELAGRDRGGNFEISYIEDDTLWFDDESGYDLCDEDWKPKIINDTNAIYEEGQ